jgi:hypothetical protein
MYPDGKGQWNPHGSYHRNGTFHEKSQDALFVRQGQPLTAAFKGRVQLGAHYGHGKIVVCDPNAFDGIVRVDPRILGPRHGSVEIDLIEPGYPTDQYFAERLVYHRQPGRVAAPIVGGA